jgi:hypothetical protein
LPLELLFDIFCALDETLRDFLRAKNGRKTRRFSFLFKMKKSLYHARRPWR